MAFPNEVELEHPAESKFPCWPSY